MSNIKQLFFNSNLNVEFEKNSLLIIGKFEVFHLGHLELIKKAKITALEKKLEIILMMYDFKDRQVIFSQENRIKLATNLGIKNILIFDPSPSNYSITIENFIKIIKLKYNVQEIFAGEDFTFNKTENDYEIIKKLIPITIVPIVKINNVKVSSSLAKLFLENSEIVELNTILNHNYFYSGRVIPGMQNGSKIGIPTANVKLEDNLIKPGYGIYVSYFVVDGQKYPSVTSIYNNTTISDNLPTTFETYILNFNEYIYGKKVRVELIKKIREPKRFPNLTELKIAIENDIKKTINFFMD